MIERIKLTGGLHKTITWIWLQDGQLKVEYYDFSELAQTMFGNDIAYTITVGEMNKLFAQAKQDEGSILKWIQENFQGYFGIKRWLEENNIAFSVEIESWA